MTKDREERMLAAHRAGRAYWTRNRPADRANVESVARSCGWGDDAELLALWMAAYFGERARSWKAYDVRTQEFPHGHYLHVISWNCDQCIENGS